MSDTRFLLNFTGLIAGLILVIVGVFVLNNDEKEHGLTTTTGVYMRCTPEDGKLICTW